MDRFFLLLLLFLTGLSHPIMIHAGSIMILAPHPDDEMIAAAGLIQKYRAKGHDVIIVYLTYGEDFPRAAGILFGVNPVVLKEEHYVRLGELRRQEANSACDLLGISVSRRIFLGYPTNGIRDLFVGDWNTLYRSRRTRLTTAFQFWGEQPLTRPFCGQNLYADLFRLLQTHHPEVLVFPHHRDTHKDHRYATEFLVRALDALTLEYRPRRRFGYFIHHHAGKFYPNPYGYLPEQPMPLPPLKEKFRWVRFPLTREMVTQKQRAIECFQSQIQLNDQFLLSFIRADELFTYY